MTDASPTLPWRMLAWICLAELGALSLWFSATAVIPNLDVVWLDGGRAAWLSMAVTLGFVAGTALSGALLLADTLGARRLFAASALVGALANAALLVVMDSYPLVLACRFVTGLAMAGAYPPAMKLAASWFGGGRGLAVGCLVGAVTVGSAVPHFANVLGGLAWRPVIVSTSLAALGAGALVLTAVRDGPFLEERSAFAPRVLLEMATDRALVLASVGYFGHMWELYAMWTWLGLYLGEAFGQAGLGDPARAAALVTALAIAMGGVGSVVAGLVADRAGRTATTIAALAASGSCAALMGVAFGRPEVLLAVSLVWGLTVVADSAQFSAAVSELAPRRYVGAALTLQTCLGFLLTLASIRLVAAVAERQGWRWAFATLVPGPVAGMVAMYALRRLPESRRLAQGRR